MSDEVKSYSKKSMPNIKNRYVVGEGKIETYEGLISIFRRVTSTHYITADTHIDASKVKFPDRGDITVSTDGHAVTYEKVANATAFMRAVQAETDRAYEKEHPWFENITGEDLKDFSIQIPRYEQALLNMYWGQRAYGYRPEVLVEDGDWVRKGQKIADAVGAPVVSPVNGIVSYTSGSAEPVSWWDYDENWPKKMFVGGNYSISCNTLAIIRPLKDEVIDNAVQTAYADFFAVAHNRLAEIDRMSAKEIRKHFYRDPADYSYENFSQRIQNYKNLLNSMNSAENRYVPVGVPFDLDSEDPAVTFDPFS